MSYRTEKTEVGTDIIIDGWENGIADSPYGMSIESPQGALQKTGLSDMRNVNIISVPGEVSVNLQTSALQQTAITAAAYTVTASNDTFTYSGTALRDGTAIVITVTTGSAGITTGHTYWVQNVTSTTFQVTDGVDSNGAPTNTVNVTSDGTGTFSTVNMSAFSQMTTPDVNNFYGTGTGIYSQISSSVLYAIDINGRAWVLGTYPTNWVYMGNSNLNTNPPQGNGIAYWNGYILLIRGGDGAIDYRAVSATTSLSAWHYAWKTVDGGRPHRFFIDVNHTLYFTNVSAIGSLIELTNFNPTNAATYTFTEYALSIPASDTVNYIEQLGSNLLIGAGSNVVYVWDKFSTGYTSLLLPEATVARMVTVNSNTYIFAGNRGRIYVTNGANVELYQKVPDHLSGTLDPYFAWGGAIYSKNQLYFSCSAVNAQTGAAIPQYGGIWAISTDTNAIRIVNRLSYGTYAGYATELAQYFTAVSAPNTSYGTVFSEVSIICGWFDGGTGFGSDYFPSLPTPYSNYEAYIDSDMIPVGTYLNPKTDANVEFKLTVPIVSGEGVKLAYRQNLTASYTDITNGEFTTAGTLSGVVKVNFQKSQWLQIRCYLKSTSSSPSYTRLREIRIR